MFIANFNLLYNHTLNLSASESPGNVVKIQMARPCPPEFLILRQGQKFTFLSSQITLLMVQGPHCKHHCYKKW